MFWKLFHFLNVLLLACCNPNHGGIVLVAAESLSLPKDTPSFKLGLINGGSPFYEPLGRGFEYRCHQLGIECHVRVMRDFSSNPNGQTRDSLMREMLDDLKVDAIAVKPGSNDAFVQMVEEATQEHHVPVVYYDRDRPETARNAYVGTDQIAMGQTMARLLRQIRPDGGTYALVAPKDGRTDGFVQEISRYNNVTNTAQASWHEFVPDFPTDGPAFDYIQVMERFLERAETTGVPLDTFVIFRQTPMRHENWTSFVDAHREKNITYIGTDGADYQLAFLNSNYVDGLVGQLPYQMGTLCVEVLTEFVTIQSQSQSGIQEQDRSNITGKPPILPLEKDIFPTNVVAYNIIPVELPLLEVDRNLVGGLKYIGIVCAGIAILTALMCAAWTFHQRFNVVVKAAQPFFLVMVSAGVALMAASMIPLSMDDDGMGTTEQFSYNATEQQISFTYDDPWSRSYRVGICMSIPWLAFVGFTVTFSALFSKTWRINKIFSSAATHQKTKVSEKDVLIPFSILLCCNVAVLICWTVHDPLIYTREEYEGTDYWNRVLATYGFCRSTGSVIPYLAPLILLNLVVLGIACWQAFLTRDVMSEFSESKYIGFTLSSIFQTFLSGIPLVFVVRDIPEAFYLITVFMIFLLCMVVLAFIFLPKILKQISFAKLTPSQQQSILKKSICSSGSMRNLKDSKSASLRNKSSNKFFGPSLGERSSELFISQLGISAEFSNNIKSGKLLNTETKDERVEIRSINRSTTEKEAPNEEATAISPEGNKFMKSLPAMRSAEYESETSVVEC